MSVKLPICDITPFTMQDFPERTACILWFGGCNMRCLYCHNPELITGKKQRLPMQQVWDFLKSRKGLLDGVVLSGGECTLAPGLPLLIREIRALGFKIKLDTNGSNPAMLESMLAEGVIDFIALDYKAPRNKFHDVTGWDGFDLFHQSLQLLCNGSVPFEVRTTVHTDILDSEDVNKIANDLSSCGFKGKYFVQNYNDGETLGNLSPQKHQLDISELPTPKNFTIEMRNFYNSTTTG